MVVSTGGDLPPPPTTPGLDPALLTLSTTSFVGPTVVPPSVPVVPQFDEHDTHSGAEVLFLTPHGGDGLKMGQGQMAAEGECFCVDEITRAKSCLVYAHFCVQVIVRKNLPNFIILNSRLGSWTQALVYENATLFCQKCHKSGHVISQCKATITPLLKLKGLALGEDSVPNAPIIHHDLNVGLLSPLLLATPTSLATEDPIIEEYSFAESIINLLQSPTKIVEEASILAQMVQCMSSMASLVSRADQLEDGEIARDPSLLFETAHSPLMAPLNLGLIFS
ncbi:hypothetical protein SUGI_0545620 [Cryptomeria japonica]|nr:hypothetical protein SUGI_0545620 [Cryptomeria japonica]